MCAIVLRLCAAAVRAELKPLRFVRYDLRACRARPSHVGWTPIVRKPVSAFEAKTVGEDNHELAPCSATNRQSEIIGLSRGVQRVFPSTVIGKIDDDLTLGSASAIFDGAS